MTTATIATRTQTNSASLWIKRAVAGSLLSLAPALMACSFAPDSFADTGDGSKSGGTSVSHASPHTSVTHVTNGAVKHHHHHRHAGSKDGGGGGGDE